MVQLLQKVVRFRADWAPVSKRCVVSPQCCLQNDPVEINCGNITFTMPTFIYLTVTDLPPGCSLGTFPNVFLLFGDYVARGSGLTDGESYQLTITPAGPLGINPTYALSTTPVPGGNVFEDFGTKVGSRSRTIAGIDFEMDIYLQIKVDLCPVFGPSPCDPPLPSPIGLTYPILIEVITYCVQTAPISGPSLPLRMFETLLSDPSNPTGGACSIIPCFDTGQPLPTLPVTLSGCCAGATFELTA